MGLSFASQNRGLWTLAALLIAGVLAPTACVLWFLNAAVNNQREASRRQLADAYRGQLTLLRDRMDSYWQRRAEDLERQAHEGSAPSASFAKIVLRGLADSAVCLTRDGSPAYPSTVVQSGRDPTINRAEWQAARTLEAWRGPVEAAAAYARIAESDPDSSIAARAARAEIRCLIRAGQSAAALLAIEAKFSRGRLLRGLDASGRLIAADEQLLAAQVSAAGPQRTAPIRRLQETLNDYATPMPSAQRLFLMREALALAPDADFPTYAAEQMAAQWLEAASVPPGDVTLRPSRVQGVWQMSAGGAVVALYKTETIASVFHELSKGLNAAVALRPPGEPVASLDQAVPAGPSLPGWHIALSLGKEAVDQVARRQALSYVWVAVLGIGVVALTAVFAGQAFQRQWRLARLKTDLVAAVSHELKTPLASISLLVDTLLDEERLDEHKTREYLGMIARENQRLSRLIENFLAYSRLERNRRKFEFRAARPDAIVRAAAEAIRDRMPASDCRFETDAAENLPPARADEDALVTALLNLLDNAIKYTPGEKRITLRAFQHGARVVFEVEDNGAGIPPRERGKIFRRFYQIDRSLARAGSGCGLGLSIVDYIVRAHGGAVKVAGEPGKGSVFSISIPLHSAKEAAA